MHFTLLGKPGEEQGVSAGLLGMAWVFSPSHSLHSDRGSQLLQD